MTEVSDISAQAFLAMARHHSLDAVAAFRLPFSISAAIFMPIDILAPRCYYFITALVKFTAHLSHLS